MSLVDSNQHCKEKEYQQSITQQHYMTHVGASKNKGDYATRHHNRSTGVTSSSPRNAPS